MGTSFGKVVSFEGRKYRVVSEIGRGRYSSIVMVKDMQTNREYALKRSVVRNREHELQQIAKHEATLLNSFPQHRHIVKSCGYKQRPQPNEVTEHLLLLEYCVGGNLYEQLGQAQRPWPLMKTLRCLSSIAQAIKHLHSQRPCIIHRDLRCENVLIDDKGIYKLCDFGSSKREVWSFSSMADLEAMEKNIEKHTSPSWRAPEMVNLRKWRRIGPEVDIWSLGVIFFHLLFLKAPFSRTSRIPTGDFVVPDHPTYSRSVTRLLNRMLEVNPAKRASIDDVLRSIREIAAEAPSTDEAKNQQLNEPKRRTGADKRIPSVFTHPLGRATSSQLVPPKAKHIRKLLVTAWGQDDPGKACNLLFDELMTRWERNDLIISFKTLQTIHKLMQQGQSPILAEAYRYRQVIVNAASKSFPSSASHYLDVELQAILPIYAKYLYQRSELHHYFPMVEGNFSISAFVYRIKEDERSFNIKNWNLKTFEALNRMFELSLQLKDLGNMALGGHSTNTRHDPDSLVAKQFRESLIIPVIDDTNAIFLTSTYLLGLLRVSMGRQRIQRHLVSYKQQFINMKHLFDQANASSKIVHETRKLPELPDTPPKLNRQATAESNIFFNPSSTSKLSDHTQSLAIFLRNKILTMFPLRQKSEDRTNGLVGGTGRVPASPIVFGEDELSTLRELPSSPPQSDHQEHEHQESTSSSDGEHDDNGERETAVQEDESQARKGHIHRQASPDVFDVFNDINFDGFSDAATTEPAQWQESVTSRGARPEDRARTRRKKQAEKERTERKARSSASEQPVQPQRKKTPRLRKSRTRGREEDHSSSRQQYHHAQDPSPKGQSQSHHARHTSVPLDEEKHRLAVGGRHPGGGAGGTERRSRKNGHGPSTSLDATQRPSRSPKRTPQEEKDKRANGKAPVPQGEGLYDEEWPNNAPPADTAKAAATGTTGSTDSWKPFTNDNSPFKEVDIGDVGDLSSSNDESIDERVPHYDAAEDELEWEDLTIGDRIGIGGFAEVFKGTWCGGEVAIKRLIHQKQTPETLEEFRAEVAIMRRLQHPNITLFMGACTVPPNMTLVTELLEMSLFDLLHNTSIALSWRIKLKIALGTARGLDFLHNYEPPIVHRDLKSANILLDKHFGPRLADFGLSRIKATNYTMTAQTGTFQWMSPEVVAGKRYTEKADVFSFGIILWELCSRKIPYEGLNGYQVSIAVVTKKIRPTIDAKLIPDDWASLMQACWQEEPTKRPSVSQISRTVEQMHRDYERNHPRS